MPRYSVSIISNFDGRTSGYKLVHLQTFLVVSYISYFMSARTNQIISLTKSDRYFVYSSLLFIIYSRCGLFSNSYIFSGLHSLLPTACKHKLVYSTVECQLSSSHQLLKLWGMNPNYASKSDYSNLFWISPPPPSKFKITTIHMPHCTVL